MTHNTRPNKARYILCLSASVRSPQSALAQTLVHLRDTHNMAPRRIAPALRVDILRVMVVVQAPNSGTQTQLRLMDAGGRAASLASPCHRRQAQRRLAVLACPH